MAQPIRRVVTGHDASGKAVVLFNSVCPSRVAHEGGIAGTSVWLTDATPASIAATDDRGALVRSLEPPAEGSIFRVVGFPPADPKVMARITRADIFGEEAKAITPTAQASRQHALMHRTRTIDYVVVMSGEIDMWLDDTTVHVKAGDVLVQQGTNHAWINAGKEPCVIAFAMIDSEKP
jgi:mannose-6-phosphate isomerase-like protein (cupin superfamily)